jgi:uncharacterized membrane protein YozB (DUF420 family)
VSAGLAFWTAALANMALVVALALRGIRQIRRGEVARHRRSMLAAAALVGVFVLSYLGKLALLGHEDRSAWTRADLAVLYFHETCIAAMLAGGAGAGAQALRLRRTRRVTGRADDPAPGAGNVLRHRRFGWTAVVAAALGLASAALVLAGMYRRAGFGD